MFKLKTLVDTNPILDLKILLYTGKNFSKRKTLLLIIGYILAMEDGSYFELLFDQKKY